MAAEPAKPAKWAEACPSYAAKSVVGQRMTMEDSWQAVPDLVVIPKWWTCNAGDHLPPNVPKAGESAAEPPVGDAGATAIPTEGNASSSAPGSGKPEDAASSATPATDCSPSSAAAAADPKQLAAQHGTDPVTVHFFAVYDGHGGPDVAKHCAKSLHENLRSVVTASVTAEGQPASAPLPTPSSAPAGLASSSAEAAGAAPAPDAPAAAETWPLRVDGIEAALKAAFLHTDSQLAQTRSAHEVGTTAVVSLVTTRHLWVGNCGDSRALLCREQEAIALSLDHKATRSDEVSRVEQAGGYVWWDRVMGELAVSRAIGDHCLRPFVIAEPEITSVLRRPEDTLLVMASDGLWDVFTNEEARTLALEKFNGELTRTSSSKMAVKKAASSLAKAALAKGSRDNVTVVVVDLRQPGGAGHHATARASGAATPNPGATAAGSGPTMTAAGPPAASAAPAQPKQQPASPVTPEVVSDADD
ncbi:hypothetical protein CHLRE_02g141250v5 [Chlamydomonas reinhardtii]|uniref:protein-serine/threonine phosphatase n=1 Tax=Chlamydomonas reinhardtii TaxID=3055 RepID=A0A2K3E435_CHLRE|nr:uncharacterized protein CHLRE_02g141250v5 [Chlamydomonas reinhardtii]PNW87560.1 hypothetical protein CHLRE_02g141250v5 [Chlamydomonas reinhardtii]